MILNGKLYRIMTEDVNRPAVINKVTRFFDGFSIIPQVGYWKGQAEKSLNIEIITADEQRVFKLAEEIRRVNQQESVLVEIVTNHAFLVGM